jgi:hypothetical protein
VCLWWCSGGWRGGELGTPNGQNRASKKVKGAGTAPSSPTWIVARIAGLRQDIHAVLYASHTLYYHTYRQDEDEEEQKQRKRKQEQEQQRRP